MNGRELFSEEQSAGVAAGKAIAFPTATAQRCDGVRLEVILLSDILGVSMLVETINHRTGDASSESTELGLFHMVESPPRELGANIARDGRGGPVGLLKAVLAAAETVHGPDLDVVRYELKL